MWNVVVHSLTLYLNSLQIFTLFHHIMPIKHVFLVKHPYFQFLPVSPGFCRLKLAGLNRFLPAGLNRSGRNQTTLPGLACQLCPKSQEHPPAMSYVLMAGLWLHLISASNWPAPASSHLWLVTGHWRPGGQVTQWRCSWCLWPLLSSERRELRSDKCDPISHRGAIIREKVGDILQLLAD